MFAAYDEMKARMQTTYPRYSEILQYLEVLQTRFPNNVRLEKIGQSIENRPIYMIIIQDSQIKPKHGIMIEAGIHAREWVSHTTALYIVDTILSNKSSLEYMDFYVIPCVNPDGYEFAHTSCRQWKKNMNKNSSEDCLEWGVDLNRNFSYGYGGRGSGKVPSAYNYRGIYSFSEPESRNLANAIRRYAHCIKLYISLHCCGELIMYPWANTSNEPSDVSDLHDCAAYALECMKEKYPDSCFRIGQISKILYLASGITADYVKAVHKIKFTFSIELHRGETGNFIIHKYKILKIAEEAFVVVDSMVKYVVSFIRGDLNILFRPTNENNKTSKLLALFRYFHRLFIQRN